MLTFFQVIGALLLLFIAFNFCVMGFGGAIIGAIACIFLPYSIETCMAWGFGIGMVIQTLYNWRLMLRVIVSGLVGLLIAALVIWVLKKCGVDSEVYQVVSLYCLIISIFAGSSWMRDTMGDFMTHMAQSRSSSSSDDNDRRCSNCVYYSSSGGTWGNCTERDLWVGEKDNACSLHIYDYL